MKKLNKIKTEAPAEKQVKAFSIDLGEPIPILDKAEISSFFECHLNDKYYEPPIRFADISRLLMASSYHQSALEVKKNIILSTIEASPKLGYEVLSQFVQDFLIFGNAYLQRVNNPFGETIALKSPMAKYVRVGKNKDFYFVPSFDQKQKLKDVFHLKAYDVNQNIYGVPPYLGVVQALLLNESATLFRRKYYVNGAHAGSILYLTDAELKPEDIGFIQKEISKTKGKGNFKNLFLYVPNGKADGIKILPLSDSMGKDEFSHIKTMSRDDILASHRVPPQLMGIVPTNTGGLGDPEKSARVFFINEIEPFHRQLAQINQWLNEEVLRFREYKLIKTEK